MKTLNNIHHNAIAENYTINERNGHHIVNLKPVSDPLQDKFNELKDSVIELFEAVKQYITDLIDSIVEFVTPLIEHLEQIEKEIEYERARSELRNIKESRLLKSALTDEGSSLLSKQVSQVHHYPRIEHGDTFGRFK